ncbi:FAD-dependent oxidoreductase [Pseudohalocynthiibacter aestuariivivens]|nr:FAD-dependent oxidoreductase [Pseudohalocynthiibacter aestuariivivens]QIE47489.1 FAD-dependent oxidoreductase [Pseudohalocynthiibacter aestuariivivens]
MVDVTVMGAGIFGLSVAYSCARRGARVQVIDPGGPGAGASGGIVGALAPHVPEHWNDKKAFQLDSLLLADRWWSDIAQASGHDPGYARSGRLQPVADDAARVLAEARGIGARDLWRGQADWQVVASDGTEWTPLTPSGLLIRDTLSARVHPRRACDALAAAIVAHGGHVGCAGEPLGAVVWATGVAGLEELTTAHSRQVGNGIKGQAALLEYDASDLPQIFVDGVHIVPHNDGTVAIGSTSERDFDDPTSTDAQLDVVISRARNAVPALRDVPVIARWAGIRPRSRSRAPMLGVHPLHAGQFIANGGFKIGFGMAPKVGEIMADMVLDGVDRIPGGFRPEASY